MKIAVNNEQLDVDVVGDGSTTIGSVLFLHGAGTSNKNRARYVADELARYGFCAILFDFSGQGASSGEMKNSSLEKRYLEAQGVIANARPSSLSCIIGSSMGAQTAIELAAAYQPKALVLFCPAVYDRNVYKVPFDSRFSEGIRQFESWRASDAFNLLAQFRGKLLIVIGSNDTVIPAELPTLLVNSAKNSDKKDLCIVEGADHQIHKWLTAHSDDRKAVMHRIISFCE